MSEDKEKQKTFRPASELSKKEVFPYKEDLTPPPIGACSYVGHGVFLGSQGRYCILDHCYCPQGCFSNSEAKSKCPTILKNSPSKSF